MKDLITPILLVVAIYSGIAATNSSHDFYYNIMMAILCGMACAIYSRLIKDNKDE